MGITLRDKSNEPNFTIIDYSDATVAIHNHPLIMLSKTLLLTAHATVP